jgi:hypothetical protein
MLPKQIENHPSGTNPTEGFRARAKYVCDKATMIKLINMTGDWETAAKQMAFTAGLNPRKRSPCCHLVCTWSETEVHTDSAMTHAIEIVLQELGAGEHQALIGIHRDQPSPHGHGVFSLVHPITGVGLSMRNSYQRLELACRKVELRMGWPPDRGHFDVRMDGDEVVLHPKPASHWDRRAQERAIGLRPEGHAAREQDRRIGRGYLRDTMNTDRIERLTIALDFASSWPVLHLALSRIGLMYQRYRSGARILEMATQRHMPASGIGTRFGLRQMSERLGEFVAAKVPLSLIKAVSQSTVQHKLRQLKRRHAREREVMRVKLRGQRSPEAQAFRIILREDHANEIKAHKEMMARAHSTLKPETTKRVKNRYSHAVRQQFSGLPPLDDHTARRQSWILSDYSTSSKVPVELKDLISRFPDTIRADYTGDILFAARVMDGSIASFERLSLQVSPPEIMPATSNLGVCGIGPHPGNICLLVRASLDAIAEMLRIDGPMPMVVVIGNRLDPARKAHIEWLTQGRKIAIATASFENIPDIVVQLRDMFPKAKCWGDVPNIIDEKPNEPSSEDTGASRSNDLPSL